MSRVSFDNLRFAAKGRWLEILSQIIGPEHLTGRNGPCPGCGGADRYQFNTRSEAGAFSCRSHERGGGDGFALVMHVMDCDFLAASRLVAHALGMDHGGGELHHRAAIPAPPPLPGKDYKAAREKAGRIWNEAGMITANDPAGLYLTGRLLPVPVNASVLRYHPELPYWSGSDDAGKPQLVGRFPAMLAVLSRPDGSTHAVHRTYLDGMGGKLTLPDLPSRKLFKCGNAMVGAAVHLGGPDYAGRLGIAEGIETALAFTQGTGAPCWAATSAGMLARVQLPDSAQRIYIATDADPAGRKAAESLAKRAIAEGRRAWINTAPDGCNDWADYLTASKRGGVPC